MAKSEMHQGTVLARLTVVVILALGVLATPAPAPAAIGQVVATSPSPPLLTAAELERLAAIQVTKGAGCLSPISPDGAVCLGSVGQAAGFLDVATGQVVPVNLAASGATLAQIVGSGWRDNDTVAVIAIGRLGGAITMIEFVATRSGAPVKARPLDIGVPSAVSPDARLVVELTEAGAPPSGAGAALTPMTQLFPITAGIRKLGSPVPSVLGPSLVTALGLPTTTVEAVSSLGADAAQDELRLSAAEMTVVVRNITTNEARVVLTLPAYSEKPVLAFSPDSTRLAATVDGFAEGEMVQSRLIDFTARETMGLIPTETHPYLLGNHLELIDLRPESPTRVTLRGFDQGGRRRYLGGAWSPDNSEFAAILAQPARIPGRPHPIHVQPEGVLYQFIGADGTVRGTLDRPEIASNESEAAVAYADNDTVLVTSLSGMDLGLFVYERAGGSLRRLPVPPGHTEGAKLTGPTGAVVFSNQSFTNAGEFYRINLDGSGLTQVSRVNDVAHAAGAVRADEVTFEGLPGATGPITGYLLQTPGAAFPPKDVPLVVWQEGGPFGAVLNVWGAGVERPYNLLPQYGFALLVVPLYGRYGFGAERFRTLYANQNLGAVDIDAQAEIVKRLIAQGWTSPGKVGITGCSYGGYFTSQSIARHPDLYAAANPQCSLLDTIAEYQVGIYGTIGMMVGSPPALDPARHVAVSPLYNANRVRAATLIFHGTNDFLPVEMAEQFHDAIQRNGVPVNMLRFVGEKHGLADPRNEFVAAQWQISWFRTYLAR